MNDSGNQSGITELYVLIMTPLPLASNAAAETPPGEPTPLEIHYAYVHQLVEQGKVLLIGPCLGEPTINGQAPVPPGIGVLRVASREEAEAIAHNEPFHTMGWRRNTVMAWTPKFGTLVDLLR
ncbi:YciI family protein [Mycobacterium sp. DL592]|uniref:YciI family protein n=1 Tax=Mycobacterium sp. DL592 TaxID=2675524 RepID=UPI00141DF113|nr:YciI family protein [Mycobacterium sp. DL592]